MNRVVPVVFLLAFVGSLPSRAAEPAAQGPADLIIHHARAVTVDDKFRIAEAVAVKDGRILAVGKDDEIVKLKGPMTKLIDAETRTVLPGLYDSHVHPTWAATSTIPKIKSLKEALAYIREQAKTTPEGEWIVLWYLFPTRLDEARFPTKAELDEAAPKHPVLFHAGPAGMVNSMALKISGVTKDTPNPGTGIVVKDAKGEPTGMLRSAYRVLKGVPSENDKFSSAEQRAALKNLFRLYNEQGLTSIADRNASRGALDQYLDLKKRGELTLRVNVARSFDPSGNREQVAKRFDDLPGKDGLGGPTGVGDDWIRIGPIKLFLDGGMLNGTAYMRQPWPKGDTYQITEDDYRGLLFIKPAQLEMVCEEGAKRKWQMTAHTAGEGAMDVLLDAYDVVNRLTPIKDLRFCITHANFPSQRNLERCKALGVCADVQPVWLYKDGTTLYRVLGDKRVRWFQPYKSWLEYTTIGGGSDHMLGQDSFDSINAWNPWLGIEVAITRKTERGDVLFKEEALTREQALRLYTINNAYLHHEEKMKGSLEPGKFADLILIDRDVLNCPAETIHDTKVLLTIVDGKVVYERKK
jgi:predicted amidohydrolase YtcJ